MSKITQINVEIRAAAPTLINSELAGASSGGMLEKGVLIGGKYCVEERIEAASGEAELYLCSFEGGQYVAKIYRREAALPEDTARNLYRITLVGETGEGGAGAAALQEALEERFYALEVRDKTRMAEDIWQRAEEDSLRGLFLRELRQQWNKAKTEEERERVTRAVRFGLAALDHRDLG